MTDHVGRLYALVAGVVVFLVAWAVVAAHPWSPRPAQDPRLVALAARNAAAAKITARNSALAAMATAAPVQPTVRVVNLPPLVVTRTS